MKYLDDDFYFLFIDGFEKVKLVILKSRQRKTAL